MLTPLIIALAKFAAGIAWRMASPAFAKKATGPLSRVRAFLRTVPLVRLLVPTETDPSELPPLNSRQLEKIQMLVEARALALGTSAANSSLLAEAVVGRLAVAQP